jgi:hypothetical protein
MTLLLKLKLQPPHAKLTLDGFWLLCLDSFDLLAPNILYFWLSKISVSVVTDDDKSRNTRKTSQKRRVYPVKPLGLMNQEVVLSEARYDPFVERIIRIR